MVDEKGKDIFVDKIFLYGTLKSDGPFYNLFSEYVLENRLAYTFGTLAKRKGLPTFFQEGSYKVYGELISVCNIKWLLNFLEPQYNDKSKKIIDVYVDGCDIPFKAYSFVCNKPMKGVEIIETGIWSNKEINYEEII